MTFESFCNSFYISLPWVHVLKPYKLSNWCLFFMHIWLIVKGFPVFLTCSYLPFGQFPCAYKILSSPGNLWMWADMLPKATEEISQVWSETTHCCIRHCTIRSSCRPERSARSAQHFMSSRKTKLSSCTAVFVSLLRSRDPSKCWLQSENRNITVESAHTGFGSGGCCHVCPLPWYGTTWAERIWLRLLAVLL